MPLLRLIVENGQNYTKYVHFLVRLALLPLAILATLRDWIKTDSVRYFETLVLISKELLHIFPCVLGQIGIINYEPVKLYRNERQERSDKELDFVSKIVLRLSMKYTTGVRILVNHITTLRSAVIRNNNIWTSRFQNVSQVWDKAIEYEHHLFHYPKCCVLITWRLLTAGGTAPSTQQKRTTRVKKTHYTKGKVDKVSKRRASSNRNSKFKQIEHLNATVLTTASSDIDGANLKGMVFSATDPHWADTDGDQKHTKFFSLQETADLPLLEAAANTLDSAIQTKSLPANFTSQSSPKLSAKKTERGYNRISKRFKSSRKSRNAEADHYKSNDFEAVRNSIGAILNKRDFDDGSLGPVLVRLTWHCCATYDKESNTGGSNGGTIRLHPELTDPGNTGLEPARSALEIIKSKHPWISYADLYTLAGVVAIKCMGGPDIEWRPGRIDCTDSSKVPPNGRSPLGSKDSSHIREVFYRMGFSDQEIVCLIGAHTLGRAHSKYSGWDGKWTDDPTKFDNEFFKALLNKTWQLDVVQATGQAQYVNEGNDLLMLKTDLELIKDQEFKKWVVLYASNQERYFEDFAKVFAKLSESGRDDQ